MNNLKNYIANIIVENRNLGNSDDKKLVLIITKKILRSHNLRVNYIYSIVEQVFGELNIDFPYNNFNEFYDENRNHFRTNPFNSFFENFISYSSFFNITNDFDDLDIFYNDIFRLNNQGFYERSIFDIYSNIFNNLFSASQMNDVPVTATEEALKRIPVIEYSKLKEEEKSKYKTCAICMDDFIEDSKIRILPCFHGFHLDCIDKWLKEYNYKCPICRSEDIEHKAKI